LGIVGMTHADARDVGDQIARHNGLRPDKGFGP
jgi:hypothetical protein